MIDESQPKLREEHIKHFEENIDKLTISGRQTKFHTDEDNEGEERPDLNFMLGVTKI